MKKSTITDLPNDIKKAFPDYESNEKVMLIIKEAEAGEYHDFKNQKYICGKMALCEQLHETNIPSLQTVRVDVMNGEYDESPDQEDKAQMKKDWLENGGSIELYESTFGKD